jgi:precorrin-3B synthase
MSARGELRRGWCPSLLRPMPSGDGLLVRLHLPCGVLSTALARCIADCARRHGNGLVDLTRHANLQLRGMAEAALDNVKSELSAFLPLPPESEPQAARNVVVSPLAGLDPRAAIDIRPIVEALEGRLAGAPGLRTLPAKFSFLVEDGGSLGLGEIAADIRFAALVEAGAPRFAVAIGGAADAAVAIGECAADELPDVAIALARSFMALRGEGEDAPRRMSGLVGRVGVDRIAAGAGSLAGAGFAASTSPRERGEVRQLIGFHLLDDAEGYLAVGAPFGRLVADQLERLAEAAEANGAELRLTPWRAVLIAPLGRERAETLRPPLERAGLVTEPDDARLAVAACPGAPACASATVATRADAFLLAAVAREVAPDGIALHLSGCRKGCARSDAASVTLIGRDGRYDLVLDGGPGDTPSRRGLNVEQARSALREIAALRRATRLRIGNPA